MADTVICAKETGASNSDEFYVTPGKPITVYAFPFSALAADEFMDLQRQDPEGNWQDVYDSNGQVRLSSARTDVEIIGEGTYRIAKEAHTTAAGCAAANILVN